MADAGYGGPSAKTQFVADKKPQKKPTKKPQDRTPAEKKADQKAKQAKKQQAKQVENILSSLDDLKAGAPFSAEFIAAALEQGLTPQQIKAIVRSGALGGPMTSEDFSSTELLDFFTENPDNIQALLAAVQTNKGLGYDNYAEYLAQGGEVGGYQSPNQLLQAAVFGIEGAKEAYVAGTPYAQYIAEGNDPRRWYLDRDEFMNKNKPPAPSAGPSFQGGFDVPDAGYDALNEFGFGDVVSQMMAARQQRMNAQLAQGDVFDIGDMAGEE